MMWCPIDNPNHMTLWQIEHYTHNVWWQWHGGSEATYLAMDADLYEWLRADNCPA